MEFWASSESDRSAGPTLEATRRKVEPLLKSAFAQSSLASLEFKLRYVPIVMPKGMLAKYPARSKSHRRERIYDCAPILNYEIFVGGTLGEQWREYLRGIAGSAEHLATFGASPTQVREFIEILYATIEQVT